MRELLNEAYLSINSLLSDAYETYNGGFRCKRCHEQCDLHAGKSQMTVIHAVNCAIGKAIKVMRKIEQEPV